MTGHDLLLAMAMEGGPVIISQYIEVQGTVLYTATNLECDKYGCIEYDVNDCKYMSIIYFHTCMSQRKVFRFTSLVPSDHRLGCLAPTASGI